MYGMFDNALPVAICADPHRHTWLARYAILLVPCIYGMCGARATRTKTLRFADVTDLAPDPEHTEPGVSRPRSLAEQTSQHRERLRHVHLCPLLHSMVNIGDYPTRGRG